MPTKLPYKPLPLTPEMANTIASLKDNPQFRRFMAYLGEQTQDANNQLFVETGHVLNQQQGRALFGAQLLLTIELADRQHVE